MYKDTNKTPGEGHNGFGKEDDEAIAKFGATMDEVEKIREKANAMASEGRESLKARGIDVKSTMLARRDARSDPDERSIADMSYEASRRVFGAPLGQQGNLFEEAKETE